MKAFMDQDFILQTQTASDLYHKFAETTPSGVLCARAALRRST